jgi:branched-chain amino acid transport system substrate-binding protein
MNCAESMVGIARNRWAHDRSQDDLNPRRTVVTRTTRAPRSAGLVAAAVCALALAVTGCASSSSKSSGSTSDTSKPLVVGASVSLTGDFSDAGKAVERGYRLWADNVNTRGGILGRKVQIKIVDDTSSPTQVVTNYQNLINKDHVDLVVGPFSSLLTVPASQVAKRYNYSFLEPAGGGPKVFAQKLNNLFEVQRAPVVTSGLVFVDWLLALPADQRPKTAAYAELDDPFASPIAETMRAKLEAAGIKTVYKQVYASETADLSPVMAAVAAAKPDLLVSGTQSNDAYAQVKSLVQLKFSPKFYYMSNGASSPVEFPDKVGAANTAGIMSHADWYPSAKATGSADFVQAYVTKYGGTADQIDPSSAEAFAVGQVLEDVAKKTGKIDNQTIIDTLHSGSWPTLLGDLSWDETGAPTGTMTLVQWQNGRLLPVYPVAEAQATPVYPKPNWGG